MIHRFKIFHIKGELEQIWTKHTTRRKWYRPEEVL